jgi:catechol 2,3-dioxygenase-like lactoylglutathione lyase family enzyme
MLRDRDVGATLAVSDFDRSKSFYGQTLGLETLMEMDGAAIYRSGASRIMVYQSEFAGTNKATAATWDVGDELDAIVQTLRGNGVSFEHYDLPGTTRDGDIHSMGGMRGVWFKDPDGNILSLVSQ